MSEVSQQIECSEDERFLPTYAWILERFPFLSPKTLYTTRSLNRELYGVPFPRCFNIGRTVASRESDLKGWYAEVIKHLAQQHTNTGRRSPKRA